MSSLRTEDEPPPANGWPPKTLQAHPISSPDELRALIKGTTAVQATATRVTEGLGEATKLTQQLARLVWAVMVVVVLLITLVGVASAALFQVSNSASAALHVLGEGMSPQQIRAMMDTAARAGGNVEMATAIGRDSMTEVKAAILTAVLSLNTTSQIAREINSVARDFARRGTIQIGVPHAGV